MFVDSHCHLDFDELSLDIENIIDRAKISGVSSILSIATRKDNFSSVLNIANRYRNIWCTIGIHPHSVSTEEVKLIDMIDYYN